MLTSPTYLERVYAGILGKTIGVYLGRPFEGWTHDQIVRELGEIDAYVHERFNVPLVVADDDLSGTFTFLRALGDVPDPRALEAKDVGEAWLNYLIEERTVLWWGGFGNSTEHTAYLRLKAGIPAPQSGSRALNGRTVSEQIGAQIFIDGWAMVAPGDPALAVQLAGKAASVSHDGEAVLAAQFLAAMEAQAFVEASMERLFEAGLRFVPADALISRLAQDVRSWATRGDWRETRARVEENYGYDRYGGNCHVIPNHAVVLLSLLHAEDDFRQALTIANTCGWDTDCNSGNVGCLFGIKNGLAGLAGSADLRDPVADRLFLVSADGGRCLTDVVRETYAVAALAASLGTADPVPSPKGGARFHFELPGSVQGFAVPPSPDGSPVATLENVEGGSRLGRRSLRVNLRASRETSGATVLTPTFIPPDSKGASHYALLASPTLYPGQTVRAELAAAPENAAAVRGRWLLTAYGEDDILESHRGPEFDLPPGGRTATEWRIEALDGAPIAQVGFEFAPGVTPLAVHLDFLDWSGAPTVAFHRPSRPGKMWRRAWVNAFDHLGTRWKSAFHLSQGTGTGFLITGTREWRDYEIQADLAPMLAKSFGLAARVQGLRRYYALLLGPGPEMRLVRHRHGAVTTMASAPFAWAWERAYGFRLTVRGRRLAGAVDGTRLEVEDEDRSEALDDGGVALVCEEGLITGDRVEVAALG